MLISVIIPAYNEETTIASVIEKIQTVQLSPGVSKEIIIVNDGSTDGTKNIIDRFEGIKGFIVIHQNNQGKTGALLAGIRASKGEILLIQDADSEYDPAEYPQLLAPILNGTAQVVYGSRFLGTIKGMQPINRWANGISNWTVNFLFKTKITDINTCYKIFTRQAIEGITICGRNFDFDCEFTVKLLNKGIRIKEVPIAYTARSREAGKKIKWSTALIMFWQIIKYRFKFFNHDKTGLNDNKKDRASA